MLKYNIVILLFLLCNSAIGQIKVVNTPKGIYGEVNDIQFAKSGYTVFRKTAEESDYQVIKRVGVVRSVDDFQKRVLDYTSILPEVDGVQDSLFIELWELWKNPENDKSFLSFDVPIMRLGLGLSFYDEEVEIGKTYDYKVESNTGEYIGQIKHDIIKSEFAEIKSIEVDPGEAFPILRFQSIMSNAALLFEIHRQAKGSDQPYQPIFTTRGLTSNTQGDTLTYFVQDTTALQSVHYNYYIIGKDMLGNYGNTSDTVSLQVGGNRNVYRGFNVRTSAVDKGIKVYWSKLNQQYALQNILIFRSKNYDDDYSLLATVPVTDTAYIDQMVEGGVNYYYQLIIQGEANASFPTARVSGLYTGVVNLLPPTLVEAAMDVYPTVSWQHQDTLNVKGFYIYRSFDANGTLIQVSDFIETNAEGIYSYQDTTATIGDAHAYYAVTAVSATQSLSPLSEIKQVFIPKKDHHAIEAPYQLRSLFLEKDVASITWYDMSKTIAAAIDHYAVFRKDSGTKAFDSQPFAKVETNEFVDTLAAGKAYDYAIQMVLDGGMKSKLSSPIHIRSNANKPLPPAKVRLYTTDENKAYLQWDASYTAMKSYHIHRSVGDGERVLLATINGDVHEYIDKETSKGKIYYYTITAVDNEGMESDRSEEVILIVED